MKPDLANGTGGVLAVCDDIRGWTVRTRMEDEATSMDDSWGERRYKAWEILADAFKEVGSKAVGKGADASNAIEEARRILLNFEEYLGGIEGFKKRYTQKVGVQEAELQIT